MPPMQLSMAQRVSGLYAAAFASLNAGQGRAGNAMTQPLTLFDKIWAQHEILKADNGLSLMWIDRHYVHEGSFQGFDKVDARAEKVARPDLTFGITDHYVSTPPNFVFNEPSANRIDNQLVAYIAKHGITLMALD